MPYKDRTKIREAYRRWAEKNKEKRKEYQKILRIAKKSNPIAQKCIVDGCDCIGERHHPDYSKPEEIIWVCRKHHLNIYHKNYCKICGLECIGRGYCNKHYKQIRKLEDPEFAKRVKDVQRQYQKTYKRKK